MLWTPVKTAWAFQARHGQVNALLTWSGNGARIAYSSTCHTYFVTERGKCIECQVDSYSPTAEPLLLSAIELHLSSDRWARQAASLSSSLETVLFSGAEPLRASLEASELTDATRALLQALLPWQAAFHAVSHRVEATSPTTEDVLRGIMGQTAQRANLWAHLRNLTPQALPGCAAWPVDESLPAV